MRRPKTPLMLTLQLGPLTEEAAEDEVREAREIYAEYSTHGPRPALYDSIRLKCEDKGLQGLCFDGHLLRLALEAPHLREPPEGYFYKGGAARSALQRSLGRPYFIRDLDIVRFGTGWSVTDNEVSVEFMRPDWELGYGVEIARSADDYLATRDLTINELYLRPGSVTMTIAAFLDSLGLVVRPSRYRSGTLSRPRMLASRTAAKVIRLKAEGGALGLNWTVLGLSGRQEVAMTDLAFELNKAFSSGEHAAQEFVKLSVRAGLLPPELAQAGSLRPLIDFILENEPDAGRRMGRLLDY